MERKEQWTIESNYVGSEKEKKDLNKILKKEYIRVREKERAREGEKGRERKKARHLEMGKSIEEGTELFYRN